MPEGFFSKQTLAVLSQPQCRRCGLDKSCHSPKMAVAGKGRKGILVVGEAPGENEDREGKPFVGASGQLLQNELRALGIELFHDCWITNALRCRPSATNKIKDTKSIDYCRPFLLQAIREYSPKLILLLGKNAVRSLIGHLWSGDVDGIHRWAGFAIPCQRYNAWLVPTYHPAHVLREEQDSRAGSVTRLHFLRHLELAESKHKQRPWVEVPDYKRCVDVEFDPHKAAAKLRALVKQSKLLAFDYETNMLKPDSVKAELVSCAVSDGKTALAYFLTGATVAATKEFLRSDVAKCGWNLKFEQRWSLAKLGTRVKNWRSDGMLDAHCLDNRKGGHTALDFQAFVHLGQEDWSSRVHPYFKTIGGNTVNRIRDCPADDLLTYNALDALLEFLLHQHQEKEYKHGSTHLRQDESGNDRTTTRSLTQANRHR